MNKRYIFAGAIAAMAMPMANAEPLTAEQALQQALHSGAQGLKMPMAQNYALALTVPQPGSVDNAVYVFSTDSSFMALSADDNAPLVLGYSDSSSFDPNNIPDGLRWWLDCSAAMVEGAAQGCVMARSRAADHPEIAPMIQTIWDQGTPYYNKTPMLGTRHAYTGCMATAMAQVMNYYKYPKKGVGSYSYDFVYDGSTYNASFDFGDTEFNWSQMRNDYNGLPTLAQKNAVATLMLACGVASKMSYSLVGSGTTEWNAAYGLVNFLGYDKSIHVVRREWYTAEAWDNLVYGYLAAGHPLIYAGSDQNKYGHAFVCDGYSKDGYYHINWGWSGVSDGYFMLANLDPVNQGIGGSGGGYDYNQNIIANMIPDEGGEFVPQMEIGESFSTIKSLYNRSNTVKISFQGSFYNLSYDDLDVWIGLRLVSQSNSADVQYIDFGNMKIKPLYGFKTFSGPTSMLPEGKWIVTPVFKTSKDSDHWIDMRYDVSANTNALEITVSPSNVIIDGAISGIDEIEVDGGFEAVDAPAEYYNLQGVKVQNPANGIYIKRQGTTTEKVMLR